MEFIVFLYPLIAMSYTIVERNLFARESTARYLKGLDRYGVKGLIVRNPNIVLVPACFVGSFWYIPTGLAWLVLGVLLLAGAAFVVLSQTKHVALTPLSEGEFVQLCKKRQLQTIATVSIGLTWLVSWVAVAGL